MLSAYRQNTFIHTCICIYRAYICIYIQIYLYIGLEDERSVYRKIKNIYIYLYICIHTYIYIYIYMYLQSHIYTYIYMYIHSHIYIYTYIGLEDELSTYRKNGYLEKMSFLKKTDDALEAELKEQRQKERWVVSSHTTTYKPNP